VVPADDRAAAVSGKRTVGRGARAGNGADGAEDLLVLGQLLDAAAASDGEKVSDAADAADPDAGHADVAEEPGRVAARQGGALAEDEIGEAGSRIHGAGKVSDAPDGEAVEKRGEESGVVAGKRRAAKSVRAPKKGPERQEPAVETVAKKRVTRKQTEEVLGEQPAPETAAGEAGKTAPRKRSPRKAARGKEIPESAAEGAGQA
jgi:hypothetical protein